MKLWSNTQTVNELVEKFTIGQNNVLDQRLARQAWVCGDAPTMADCAVIPPLFYAQTALPFDPYPNLLAYWQRAQQRPSYARVRAEFEPIWNGLMNAK